MSEKIQLRIHGAPSQPTLIYLPGLHGDWTLVAAFRNALAGRVRFIEITYPRTLTWSLEDYAAAVEEVLGENGIHEGWLLGESFSSQVVWAILGRKRFRVQGVVLSGGFVRHPMQWGARLAERLTGRLSFALLTRLIFGYAKVARFRYRHSPEVIKGLDEFIARRTDLDRQAARHRLALVASNDPCPIAGSTEAPVYAMTGLFDPIVPWFRVRPWLKRNCPALRDYRIIWRADHNVLGTAPRIAAEQVLRWMAREDGLPGRQPPGI